MSTHGRSASRIQAELENQRMKVSTDVDLLMARLTPGQMVDEFLARTKHGGGEFVANLGRSATDNPIPVTLLAVSVAWLMAATGAQSVSPARDRGTRPVSMEPDLPLARVSGRSIRRVSRQSDDEGESWSHFADESGRRFKAQGDSLGRRAGHFFDEAGQAYRGFVDDAGEQISTFLDEAGVALDEALGWASDTWATTEHAASNAGKAVRSATHRVAGEAVDAGVAIEDGARRLNNAIAAGFRAQPLVGGALAFAVGAALASALPHTETEDDLLGDSADKVKGTAEEEAERAFESTKETVAEVYRKATDAVANT